MKDVFGELEAEVAQCAADRKHDAIDLKNLLIADDNLIAECLSKEIIQRDVFCGDKVTKLTTENVNMKTCVSKATVNPQVSIPDKHAIDVEPIVLRLRNNRDAHLDYLRHLKERVETIRDIVEEAKVLAHTPLIRKKQVTATKPSDRQDSNKHKHVVIQKTQKTNVSVPHSTGVKRCPKASGSQPKRNPKTNRISPAKGANKLHVEDLPRTNKSYLRTTNRVDSSSRLKCTVINSNSDSICQTCNKCLTSFDHDTYVAICMKSIVRPHSTRHNCEVERKIKQVWKPKHVERNMKQVWKLKQVGKMWKPTGKVLTTIGHQWRPTGWILHLGKQCPLTRFTPPQVVSAAQNKKQASRTYRPLFDSRMTTFGAIMGYGDYVVGESVISRVYYVEGLGHNLLFVRQFCDFDLEVAFRKHSCYVRDTDGVDLINGSRGSNFYTISVEDMMKSSPICLLSKASKNKSWLWHRRLNHLNFGTINDLARKDLVRGLRRLKFEKDRLCSACQLGESKKHTHTPKVENTNLEVLKTFHMDLCGPMRVQTINEKKYILVIVDDYSRFTWVKFLRSKDETSDVVIKFITQIQVDLNKTVRYVRTDNGTEFVNHTMTEYYEGIGIFHQKKVPRTPQQNGFVERRNRTLVEAARTMLIFSKAPMFLWAEAVATACYTQNRSLIHTRHHKTPYELVHNKNPDLTFFRVFDVLCYPTNGSKDLGKLQPTADTGIFVGYAPSRNGYRIFNKRTRRPAPNFLMPGEISSGLVPNLVPATPYAPPTNKELEILFKPMFDEYLEPSWTERPRSPAQAVQAPVTSASTPLSTTIDQDAPSPHISPSSLALQSHSLPPGVVAKPHFMEDHNVAPVDNNPFVNVLLRNLILKPHHQGISAQPNHHMFLNHFIISTNGARIAH
nr:retrovirus-related Pol polyprotein from transposon TNT 1-94 [Tanacetum cinerariifolium]